MSSVSGKSVITYDYENSILTSPASGLASVFYPTSIAVIGATERPNSVGSTIVENLIKGNKGNFKLFPVNPTRETIHGIPCFKSIGDCPGPVSHAVIVLPAKAVPGVTTQCGQAGVKALTIISAGFKEVGDEGLALENNVVEIARSYNMRVVGPNCLGVMTPEFGLNATFAARMALEGSVAFISQSGAMCTAALDWATKENVGFSAFVSIGSMADVEWYDMINYLGDCPDTKAILIYMETIGDAKAFLSAARAVTSKKPIIVLKAGKSSAAAEAAASHTGSLAGSHDSYLAAMKACGVLTVDSIRDLFDIAMVIEKQSRPKGNRLCIITNAGGPGVLATDATATEGGDVVHLSESIVKELDTFLPAAWSRANPVDVLGDANAECYAKTLEVCLKDPNADGVLVILSPQSVTEPLKTAQAVVEAVSKLKANGGFDKPIICSWMGGIDIQEGFSYLNKNGIPCISSPDDAAKAFCALYRQGQYLKLANEQPSSLKLQENVSRDAVQVAFDVLAKAQKEGQEILSEYDSKVVLKSFGIPIVETIVCETKEAAGEATKATLFPAVCKLHSDTITHKSDVGGVILSLKSKAEVEAAFDTIKANCIKHASLADFQGVTVQPMLDIASGLELLAGSIVDPQFGPLVVFGSGGCMVEIYGDTCTGIPPFTPTAAQECINNTKIAKALHGVGNARFPGIDMAELNKVLVNFSRLVSQVTQYVAEIEINPLLALKDRMVALDARVVIRSKDNTDPIPMPIIRPYPANYETIASLSDGEAVTLRLLNVYDTKSLGSALEETNNEDFKSRFLNQSREAVNADIVSMCNADYNTSIPLAAFNSKGEILGVCRSWSIRQNPGTYEMKIMTFNKFKGKGVAKLLVQRQKAVAAQENVKSLQCLIQATNDGARHLLKGQGFQKVQEYTGKGACQYELVL